jgi:hypothetical protein
VQLEWWDSQRQVVVRFNLRRFEVVCLVIAFVAVIFSVCGVSLRPGTVDALLTFAQILVGGSR